MVLAYHVIFCLYGFWLPNDPRGSWSDFVGAWELARFGRSTQTHSRRSLAQDRHDRALREAAKRALKYPPVALTGLQARAVGRGFGEYVRKSGIWARWQWKVFLDSPDDIVRSCGYVVDNPEKGLPPQTYPFVTPYVPTDPV